MIPTYTGFYHPGTNTWTDGPMMTGILRKGGAGAVVGHAAYYGLGTNGTDRLKDWTRLDVPAGIQNISADPSIAVVPNPAGDAIRVTGLDGQRILEARIMDAQGRTVRTLSASAVARPIDLRNGPTGLLVLVVRTGGGMFRLSFLHLP